MSQSPSVPLEISCRDVQTLRESGAPLVLLDCREPDEFEIAQISGATLVPMSSFVEGFAEIRDSLAAGPLVVYCHHGGRSLRVTQWLRGQGFPHAQSMHGGIDAWAQEIEPGMPRY